MSASEWIALGELVVAIIVGIVGFIGGKELHEANKLKVQIGELNSKIEKIELNNSQVANTINNNGIGLKDAMDAANMVVEEKTKNMKDEVISDTEPTDQKVGGYWLQDY